jgi:hypothetical protein
MMGYIAQGLSEDEFRSEYIALRKREVDLAEYEASKSTFWKTAAQVATVAIPLFTFFGFKEYLGFRRRRRKK